MYKTNPSDVMWANELYKPLLTHLSTCMLDIQMNKDGFSITVLYNAY